MHHRVRNQEFSKRNLLMDYRIDFQSNRQLIGMQKRWLILALGSANCDVIEMCSERLEAKTQAANRGSPAGCSIRFFRNLIQSEMLEALASQVEISPDCHNDQENQQSCQRPTDDSFPAHIG